VSTKAENVHELAEAIGKKLADAEQAGAEGKVSSQVSLCSKNRSHTDFCFRLMKVSSSWKRLRK